MKIKEIMRAPVMVEFDSTVRQAAAVMKEKGIGSVLVCMNGKNCVILTELDILNRVVAKWLDASKTRVAEVMTKALVTIDAETDIEKASEVMREHNIRRLPITEKSKIVGIVTARDIAKNISFYYAKKFSDRDFERPHYYEERMK